MPGEVIVHVGVHKTGSSSIQHFLNENRARLLDLGVAFYEGQHNPSNHMELHAATMRAARMSPFKLRRLRMTGVVPGDDAYVAALSARLRDFANAAAGRTLLFSAEGLSYLYYPDEMARLAALLPAGTVKIVMYVREPVGFLASYRDQLAKTGYSETPEKDSFGYCEPDSWMLDFPERVRRFQSRFGTPNVRVIDYDREVCERGTVIPSFLDEIGLRSSFNEADWKDILLNRRES